ncbi:hypothetical protein Shew_1240 [Shewanella loihica PV-4]|uniref:Iron uptake protein n=1 Tax=Shewanella loihica (strain ATCC BAA-1088 / PV-4) TaxID=323850 RepID=A3QCB2_SHELP|nr:hypothetical protein Shew_1240 [Shewanella loihica PV-4]
MNTSISPRLTSFGRDLSPRASVIVRLLASLLGGYGVAALACMLLAQTLPLSRLDAVLVGTMVSFSIFAMMIIRLFSLRSHLRVVLEPVALCTLLYGLILVLG